MAYIVGTALIRSDLPGKIEYREEPENSYTFQELLGNRAIGRTARGDKALLGCSFSFTYENPNGAFLAQDNEPADPDDDVKESIEKIRNYYQQYLTTYETYSISEIERIPTDHAAKILLWGKVSNVAGIRETILNALKHFGVFNETLRAQDQKLNGFEMSIRTAQESLPANIAQTLIDAVVKQGTEYLLSFEKELQKAEQQLQQGEKSLRFLFFTPQIEYQCIRDVHSFLPLQIRSVLCIRSVGTGDKPESKYENFESKILEKIGPEMSAYFTKAEEKMRTFQQNERSFIMMPEREWQKIRRGIPDLFAKAYEINGDNLKQIASKEQTAPPPVEEDEEDRAP